MINFVAMKKLYFSIILTFLLLNKLANSDFQQIKFSEEDLTNNEEPRRFSNIMYMGVGYDIYKGNPQGINNNGQLDPGFKGSIFNLTVDGDLTPDHKFILPKGIVGHECISCEMAFSSQKIQSIYDYSRIISRKVGGNIGFNKAFKFSASWSYKKIYNLVEERNRTIIANEANCAIYCLRGQTFSPRIFSEDFLMGVSFLSNDVDDPIYLEFIDSFGTHYINSMTLGSDFASFAEFNWYSWKEINDEKIDISVASSIVSKISGGIDITDSDQKKLAESFRNRSENVYTHSVGSPLPKSGRVEDWIPMASQNPMPQQYDLKETSDLLISRYFPNDNDINLKKENLKINIEKYCQELKKQGIVKFCSENEMPKEPITVMDVFECPESNNIGNVNGCVGQLSSSPKCRNVVDSWFSFKTEYQGGYPSYNLNGHHNYRLGSIEKCYHKSIFSNSKIYYCPSCSNCSGKTSCIDQITFKDECYNNNEVQKCQVFDIENSNVYKCPFFPYSTHGSFDHQDLNGSWERQKTTCLGQYSNLDECFIYRISDSKILMSFDCELVNKKSLNISDGF